LASRAQRQEVGIPGKLGLAQSQNRCMIPPPPATSEGFGRLRERGLGMAKKRAHHGSGWTASDRRKLKVLVERGAPRAQIAHALGRSVSAVYQRIVTERLSPRPDLT